MTNSLELANDGPSAPPRANGELIFDAPWQSRAFGIAAALVEDGRLDWPQFQAALIETVPHHENYWDAWLVSLVDLTETNDLIAPSSLVLRTTELFERPAGHDHG